MKTRKIQKIIAAVLVLQASFLSAVCQTKPKASSETATSPQIVNFDKPPTFQINAKDLPKPYVTESARRNSSVVAQPKDAKQVG